MKDDGSYYAEVERGLVLKSLVAHPRNPETGMTNISIGFPVCIMHDAVGDAAAAAVAELMNRGDQLAKLTQPRPIAEYHEDMGNVLWWCWKPAKIVRENEGRNEPPELHGEPGHWLGEPPYVGTPNDGGFEVLVETTLRTYADEHPEPVEPDNGRLRVHVGGWPGYHTHFTPLPPMPDAPK